MCSPFYDPKVDQLVACHGLVMGFYSMQQYALSTSTVFQDVPDLSETPDVADFLEAILVFDAIGATEMMEFYGILRYSGYRN